jgi:hypothetical protein
VTEQGQGSACATGAAPARVGCGATGAAPFGVGCGMTGVVPNGAGRCGPRSSVTGAAARVKAMREREKREKERAGAGTIPAYVCRADTSANEYKRAGLRGGRGALCSSAVAP